jgi:cell wall-associated NlpC family hydrolase
MASTVAPDPRLHAYTPQLADVRLRGRVEAERFVEGVPRRIRLASAPMRMQPDANASYATELLLGEGVRVFDDRDDGWSWCQNDTDGYVGFVRTEAIGASAPEPTHRVTAVRTFVYPGADMKYPPVAALSLGARLTLGEEVETRRTSFRIVAGTGHAIVARHVAPNGADIAPDYVTVAERFLNVPYLWGGRTSLGLDCSALVQLALMEAGTAAPRDTDMQRETIGTEISGTPEGGLQRGDLVFWPGHVAILTAPDRIVHASGHHMAVVAEPLAAALARIGAASGPPVAFRRP